MDPRVIYATNHSHLYFIDGYELKMHEKFKIEHVILIRTSSNDIASNKLTKLYICR